MNNEPILSTFSGWLWLAGRAFTIAVVSYVLGLITGIIWMAN